jgi:diguanylate cyclase (GGDEF)-like protein
VLVAAVIAGVLLVVLLALVLRRRADRRFEAFLQAVDYELDPLFERLRRATERIDAAGARGVRADELALRFPEIERDELTGLRNRVGYEADLQREIEVARRTGRPLSLLLLDVRDSDAERNGLLRELATLLQPLTRATDTIFRRGEDELGVLLPETPAEGARRFGSRVREAVLRAEFSRSGPPTLAVGLVEWRPDESTEAFDARAEAALGPFEPPATLRPHLSS